MKKKVLLIIALLLSIISLTACHDIEIKDYIDSYRADTSVNEFKEHVDDFVKIIEDALASTDDDSEAIILASQYDGEPSIVVNNNIPYFTEDELTTVSYEKYSELDSLGRCGVATACIGSETLPTEERGEIGQIRPSGWHTVKYANINGKYLYNRCHLIAYCLSGENANELNLITGTRYLNVEGMLPYELLVAKYMDKNPDKHVMYRVTPIFDKDNLLAEGVLMEAYSVEDNGTGVQFCVFCYNVQPGITIDYATGDSDGPKYE